MTFNSGLEGVVAAETVLSEVDGEAGRLVLRGHRLQDIAGRRSVEWLIAELWRGLCRSNLSEPSLRRETWRRCAPRCSTTLRRCCRRPRAWLRSRRCACCWPRFPMTRRTCRCD